MRMRLHTRGVPTTQGITVLRQRPIAAELGGTILSPDEGFLGEGESWARAYGITNIKFRKGNFGS